MQTLQRVGATALAIFAFFFLVFMLVVAWPAHADPLVVPNQTGGWDFTPFFTELQNFIATILLAVLTGGAALLLQPVNKWLGTHIEAQSIIKDLKLDEYARTSAVPEAIKWAKQQSGLSDEQLKDVKLRNPFLSLAAGYLLRHDSDVWTWAANTEKGVMSYIEAHLPAGAAMAPVLVDGVGPVTTVAP